MLVVVRSLTYYVGTSLDGFIAGPGDEVEFFPVTPEHVQHMVDRYPEVLPTHVRTAMGVDDLPNLRFDTVVQGRGTYRPALDLGITSPYAHLRQIVASTTLEVDDPAVTVVADAVATVRDLKAGDGAGIFLAGGGRLAGALLAEIDALVVKVYPVLAGNGVRMVEGGFAPSAFTLTDRAEFAGGAVVLEYVRAETH